MAIKLPELKQMLKDNKIKGYSHYSKPQLIELFSERGLLPVEPSEESLSSKLEGTPENEYPPRYKHLFGIRTNPKKVEIKDLKTCEVNVYPSIYQAAKALNVQGKIITLFSGRVYKDKYEIKVL
jgi:hypothetical protein